MTELRLECDAYGQPREPRPSKVSIAYPSHSTLKGKAGEEEYSHREHSHTVFQPDQMYLAGLWSLYIF